MHPVSPRGKGWPGGSTGLSAPGEWMGSGLRRRTDLGPGLAPMSLHIVFPLLTYVLPGRHLPPLGLSIISTYFCVAGQCTLRSSGCFFKSCPAPHFGTWKGDAWCREWHGQRPEVVSPALQATSARSAEPGAEGGGLGWAAFSPLWGWAQAGLCARPALFLLLMLKSLCL